MSHGIDDDQTMPSRTEKIVTKLQQTYVLASQVDTIAAPVRQIKVHSVNLSQMAASVQESQAGSGEVTEDVGARE